jgi:type II secretory ATPase GspE/PulE/Tfp pilus assembly ATPase PilB-like protein
MYNIGMESKIIKKVLAYAKQNEIIDLTITKKDGNHLLSGEGGFIKHQIKLPAKFEAELGLAYRRLLSLAPTDLVSGAYFKDKDSAFKISIIPDATGEKIIINTVAKTRKIMPLSHLGLGRNEKKLIETFLKHRRGLIVIGADDNQGKTTTLYSLLQKIDKEKRSCYLLEKHSELELDEINKVVSFGEQQLANLKKILKSDSEVIAIDDADNNLINEAILAANTGRLVIVGIKSDSAASLVEKIRKLSTVNELPILLIYQRLLVKNCPHCLKAYLVNESEELITKYWPQEKKYKPKHFFSSTGCPKCNHSGINGQIASFHLIEMNKKEINILSSLASDVLQKAANGLISMSKFIAEYKSETTKKL